MVKYTGYHGTDSNAAEKIFEEQYFKQSRKEDEWLGNGAYFFWEKDDAVWWCETVKKISKYAVLQTDITSDKDKVLDLCHCREHIEKFQQFCVIVSNKSEKMVDGRKRNNYMALALKLLFKEWDIDVVIAAFDRNREFWQLGFPKKQQNKYLLKFPILVAQVQICVKNNDCINNIIKFYEK